MPEQLAEKILNKIDQASGLYHRLIIVAAPSGSGKTAALKHVSEKIGQAFINVNLEISRRMLDLTIRQRILQLPKLLQELIEDNGNDIVILDNIEILFDLNLKQDPLRLLQSFSRNKTIIAAWNGGIEKGQLNYAVSSHPEFRRYPIDEYIVIGNENPGMQE